MFFPACKIGLRFEPISEKRKSKTFQEKTTERVVPHSGWTTSERSQIGETSLNKKTFQP